MTESKGKKGNPVSYLFGKMWHYSEGRKKNVLLFWGMFVIGNAISLFCQPLLWANIINTIQKQGVSRSNIWDISLMLLMVFGINLVFWLFHGPGRILEEINAFHSHVSYRRFLLQGVMTQPLEWHTEHHSGDTIDKVNKGTDALYEFSECSFEIVSLIVQLSVSYAMLAYYCHLSAVIVLVMMMVAFSITIRFDRVIVEQYRALNHIDNKIAASIFDAISNITTIIILRTERLIYNSIVEKILSPFKLYKQNIVLNEFKWFLTSMCCVFMTVTVIIAFFWEKILTHQNIMIGSIFLLIKYLENISDMFFRFTGMYAGFLRRKSRIMNSEELTEEFKSENFTNHVLPKDWERLNIKGLDFSYNGSDSGLDLYQIDLEMQKGEKIAFVGETGSGKTTLLKIIRDLYHPQSLDLTVDGKLITDGFSGIARAITLVPQDPEIFSTTILENITLGAGYKMDEVLRATEVACFTDVAESLPKKFDSSIKEKGVNLSGGQQQRLALSRGILACGDKDIVLLDEPTSSIDTVNEMRIYQNIFNEFEGKTIISSVHRLHLLSLFDKIVVFDHGKIVGSGSLTELIESCPVFQKLWNQVNEIQS